MENPEEVAKEEKPVKITQNEITRPKEGTKTGRVFDIADGLSAAAGAPAKRKEVLDACEKEGINTATAATQYGRWRKFNGLEGRDISVDQTEEVSTKPEPVD